MDNGSAPPSRKSYLFRLDHSGSFRELSAAEKVFLDGIDFRLVGRLLLPLLVFFVIVNALDVWSTYVAARYAVAQGTARFVEFNPLAAFLFTYGPTGWIMVIDAKIVVAAATSVFVLTGVAKLGTSYFHKLVGYASYITLCAADVYLGIVVLGSNLPQLVQHGLLTL